MKMPKRLKEWFGLPSRAHLNVVARGSPREILANAITQISECDPRSRLASIVKQLGNSDRVISETRICNYWIEIESSAVFMAAPYAQKSIINSAHNEYKELLRRQALDIQNINWRQVDNLTPIIQAFAQPIRDAVAECIGDDLVGETYSSLPASTRSALSRFAGPSGLLNSLFSHPEERTIRPDDWQHALNIIDGLYSHLSRFDSVVWHGFGHSARGLWDVQVGQSFEKHHSFLHCSLWSVESFDHAEDAHWRDGKHFNRLLGKINLPSTSPILYRAGFPHEYEVFLPPLTSFRVVSREDLSSWENCKDPEITVITLEPTFPKKDALLAFIGA